MVGGAYVWLGRAIAFFAFVAWCRPLPGTEAAGARQFQNEIQPLLVQYCYDCHGGGMSKGNVAFDEFKSDADLLGNHDLWWKALKNLRAGVMPPEKKPQPTAAEKERIGQWIKSAVFQIDPQNPDPGRVTVRRLNRVEYRNTIRDLMGVDFNAELEFPPDDTGHGFDNNGDVLTLPAMLLEKYLNAANTIVAQAVPTTSGLAAEKTIAGQSFLGATAGAGGENREGPLSLSYYEPKAVTNRFRAEQAGRYQLVVQLKAREKYVKGVSDQNKCRLIFKADGMELLRQIYTREGDKAFRYVLDQEWSSGQHELAFELQPLTPNERQVRSLTLRIDSVTVRGPLEEKYWTRPANYARFFPKAVPKNSKDRRAYAKELLGGFATKAFRRPVDEKTVDRLAALAEQVYRRSGQTFEAGVAHAMVAVLGSPRFLFREEAVEPNQSGQSYPNIDEYALASRLSYFLWSSMPDDELFRLAGEKKLRASLATQVNRMLADARSAAWVQNFTGQWLQARDIETVVIDEQVVLAREEKHNPEIGQMRARLQELRSKPEASRSAVEKAEIEKLRAKVGRDDRARVDLNSDLRRAMRRETERYFEHVAREDRPLVELIDSDYTFLNERLANYYGVSGVSGDEMRQVTLPADSPRGGILTQGTVLAVTSNPTRTSPVKRGLFILDNILGMPPPPPPPNIPALEAAAKEFKDREPTLREMLAQHRIDPLCSSCHNRMDPLGLALENFNALGLWRDRERDQPVDATGKLITGEAFTNIRELKHILTNERRRDFQRCLTEKLLTYALGRGLETYDVQAVDDIVARIEKADGRFSALLMGVVESAPFQKRRDAGKLAGSTPSAPGQRLAEIKVRP
jgi:hypothetical protein